MLHMDSSIWDQVLGRIETKVNRHSFYTWFKPTSFVAEGNNAITVRVPNQLFKDWLTKHYSLVLTEALAGVPDSFLADRPREWSPARARAAIVAFLWKRLRAPRPFIGP